MNYWVRLLCFAGHPAHQQFVAFLGGRDPRDLDIVIMLRAKWRFIPCIEVLGEALHKDLKFESLRSSNVGSACLSLRGRLRAVRRKVDSEGGQWLLRFSDAISNVRSMNGLLTELSLSVIIFCCFPDYFFGNSLKADLSNISRESASQINIAWRDRLPMLNYWFGFVWCCMGFGSS